MALEPIKMRKEGKLPAGSARRAPLAFAFGAASGRHDDKLARHHRFRSVPWFSRCTIAAPEDDLLSRSGADLIFPCSVALHAEHAGPAGNRYRRVTSIGCPAHGWLTCQSRRALSAA